MLIGGKRRNLRYIRKGYRLKGKSIGRAPQRRDLERGGSQDSDQAICAGRERVEGRAWGT